MQKHTLCLAFLLSSFFAVHAQDYIVTWTNDTIACRLSANPKKDRLKPLAKYKNGHERIVSFFDNDSLRTIEPGKIKSYYRKDHGTSLLCNGYFDSKLHFFQPKKEKKKKYRATNWYFLQRVVEGKYASLYLGYFTYGDGCTDDAWYISRPGTDTAWSLMGKKHAVELLSDAQTREAMKKIIWRSSSKGYSDIVNAYNRIREEMEP